jgi:hypothetical protein
MPLYQMTGDHLIECKPVTFAHLEIKEREGIQRLLRDQVSVIGDDLYVVAEEFGEWEDANRRIDLLAVDKQGHLVVIELKRTQTGGHMELQALRYAAMVSAMTFEQLVQAHESYLTRRSDLGIDPSGASDRLQAFLDLDGEDRPVISSDVRILLVSGDFSREITTTVLWLNRFRGHGHSMRSS